MEKVMGFDKRGEMINELLQGMEFAKELRNQINKNPRNTCLSSSDDDHQALIYVEKMLCSFDKTITIAKLLNIQVPQVESPHSLNINSPISENSHPGFSPSKKRKAMMSKWTKSVKISNGGMVSGIDGALEDGFSWRKYGQKEILGAKHPRGYYRCTHRHTKGCSATKQVQKSDQDQSSYQITYKGEHTCLQGAHMVQAQSNPIVPAQIKSEPQPPPSPEQQEVYVGLSAEGDLKVESEQQADNQAQFFRSFSFSSPYLQPEPIDNFMLNFGSALGSPTTSESMYLPIMQCNEAYTGLTVQTWETDINETISGPNSVTNSPAISGGDFEFRLDELPDFYDNFSFDI